MLDRYLKICSIQILVFDFISLNGFFFFTQYWMQQYSVPVDVDQDTFLLASNISWAIALYTTGIYFMSQQLSFERITRKTIQSVLYYVLLMLLFVFLNKEANNRLFIATYCLLFITVALIDRMFFYMLTNYILRRKEIERKVVIVGYNDLSKKLVDNLLGRKSNLRFEGYFEESSNVHELSYYPVIGNLQDCVTYAQTNNIREIYSTLSPEQFPYLYTLAHEAEKHFIRFRFVPDFRMFVNRQIYIDYLDNIPIISLRSEPLDDIANRIRKRVFDITFSVFVMVFILSWLIPLLALLVKLESRGPVFFIQHRTGRNNQTFRCLKFRSMYVNNDANSKQASRNDRRFTKIGRILRKTNLDEMPQFLNVFVGDMSIVGPRPHMLKHTAEYSAIIQKYMIRHFLKPGITGWAQVNGYRGEITEEVHLRKRIEHDIWYMENWSVYLDLRIIFLTVFNTIRGDKNAF